MSISVEPGALRQTTIKNKYNFTLTIPAVCIPNKKQNINNQRLINIFAIITRIIITEIYQFSIGISAIINIFAG